MKSPLIGDLPAQRGLGESDGVGGLAGGGAGHSREGDLYIVALGPDGNFFHGVAVGDGGFFKAVGYRYGCKAVDAGDFAMAIAEAWGVAGSGGGDSVSADVDAGLDRFVKEKIFDQGVELLSFLRVAGLKGKAGVGEEALGMVEVVVVNAQGEVRRGGSGFSGVVAA